MAARKVCKGLGDPYQPLSTKKQLQKTLLDCLLSLLLEQKLIYEHPTARFNLHCKRPIFAYKRSVVLGFKPVDLKVHLDNANRG